MGNENVTMVFVVLVVLVVLIVLIDLVVLIVAIDLIDLIVFVSRLVVFGHGHLDCLLGRIDIHQELDFDGFPPTEKISVFLATKE